jgi:RNA polymerase sigma factor (sigma-70 family)
MARKYGDTTRMQSSLDRLQRGDESARKELLIRAQRRLRALATKMLASFPLVKDRYDIDALVSDVNSRLLVASKSKINDLQHFMNTVTKTIRCQLIDLHRTLKRVTKNGGKKKLVQNHSSALRVAKANTVGPLSRAEKNEMRNEIHAVIGTLKAEYREVLDLQYYLELTLPEIASKLGVSLATVKRRLAEAKEKLGEHPKIQKHNPNRNSNE